MRILALDIATTTGWARWDSGLNRPHADEVKLKAADEAKRFAEFAQWLRAKLIADQIDHLAIEMPVPQRNGMTNLGTLQTLHGLRAIAMALGGAINIPIIEVNNQEWRQHFLGQRVAPKSVPKDKRSAWWKKQCVKRCEELGWTVKGHNAADALGVLDFVRCTRDFSYGAASGDLFRQAGAA
jgi:hypothetical protein